MYLCLAESSHTLKTLVVVDGHNAWNYRTSNSNLPAVIIKLQKNVGVVKKLCDNDIRSSIDLKNVRNWIVLNVQMEQLL